MSELTTINNAAIPQTAAVVQISEWAAELGAAKQLGAALATSGMIPDSLRKDGKSLKHPDQVAADSAVVILAGKSVGLDPLAAVQNIFPVHGKPAMYARTMVGLAQGQGHEVERVNADSNSVTIRARRKGKSEWHSFTWDMDRAKRAGYLKNDKYSSDPIAMLTAKAQSEACRVMFADVLMGMPYSVEDSELEDMGEVEPEKPKNTVKRKTSTKNTAESKPAEPEVDEEPTPPAAVTGEGYITQQTWDELNSLATEKGIENVPAWISEQLGRKLQGWSEITEAEGDQLLEILTTGEVQP